jgi:hypothetical protein
VWRGAPVISAPGRRRRLRWSAPPLNAALPADGPRLPVCSASSPREPPVLVPWNKGPEAGSQSRAGEGWVAEVEPSERTGEVSSSSQSGGTSAPAPQTLVILLVLIIIVAVLGLELRASP